MYAHPIYVIPGRGVVTQEEYKERLAMLRRVLYPYCLNWRDSLSLPASHLPLPDALALHRAEVEMRDER